MAEWGAALQALGQGLMQLPQFQQQQQDRQRLKIEQAQADELQPLKVQQLRQQLENQAASQAREAQQFDFATSDDLASDTRIGESYLLDDPVWKMIQKGAGKTLFEGVRANPVAADPLKGDVPFLPDATSGTQLGQNTPLGQVAGMKRVPNMTEKLALDTAKANAQIAANTARVRQGDDRNDIARQRIEQDAKTAEDRLELARAELRHAQASGDMNRALRAQNDVIQATLGVASIRERMIPPTNPWTGELPAGAAGQTQDINAILDTVLKRLVPPQAGGTPASPALDPGARSLISEIQKTAPDFSTPEAQAGTVSSYRALWSKYQQFLADGFDPNDPNDAAVDAAFESQLRALLAALPK